MALKLLYVNFCVCVLFKFKKKKKKDAKQAPDRSYRIQDKILNKNLSGSWVRISTRAVSKMLKIEIWQM